MLGLAFLLFYVVALCSSILYNRDFLKVYRKDRDKALALFPVSSVLGCSLIVAFSIEVFARGYGYFSPGILLAMVSIFLVTKKGRAIRAGMGPTMLDVSGRFVGQALYLFYKLLDGVARLWM